MSDPCNPFCNPRNTFQLASLNFVSFIIQALNMDLLLIQNKIYEILCHKVMLDLAELYEVQTKALNQAVKRNFQRFPIDFIFRLTPEEWETMRSQNVTALPNKRNISATPYAFTEQGLAMLSGILNSDKAIDVNIEIM